MSKVGEVTVEFTFMNPADDFFYTRIVLDIAITMLVIVEELDGITAFWNLKENPAACPGDN